MSHHYTLLYNAPHDGGGRIDKMTSSSRSMIAATVVETPLVLALDSSARKKIINIKQEIWENRKWPFKFKRFPRPSALSAFVVVPFRCRLRRILRGSGIRWLASRKQPRLWPTLTSATAVAAAKKKYDTAFRLVPFFKTPVNLIGGINSIGVGCGARHVAWNSGAAGGRF